MNLFFKFFKNIYTGFSQLLYPNHIKCIFCNEEIKNLNNYDTCENCFKILPKIEKDFCLRCGSQLEENSYGSCQNCKRNNFDFELARAVFRYDGDVKNIIHELKYKNGKFLAEPLAEYLYQLYLSLDLAIDTVTAVPLYPTRQKLRGYNQAEEITKHFCQKSKLKYSQLLKRVIDTPSQTELSGKERMKNIHNAFKADPIDIKDKNILIIDDVYTTGATVNETAKVLKLCGAKNIYVLTLAHSCLKEIL